MTNYNQLRNVCKETSALSNNVIDEFLLPYSVQRQGLQEINQRLKRFKHLTKGFGENWVAMTTTQYTGHRIFRKNGFIEKYLQHSSVKALLPEERKFLEQQSLVPWRYSFSTITGNPDPDFYEMKEAFTGESYLLYSPSISQILIKEPVSLWLNLVGYNGACWQSYGPILSFSSFGPDDIFFFATELNPSIETDTDLMEDVDNNPVPYLVLSSCSGYPISMHGQDQVLQVFAEYPLATFDSARLKRHFKTEYAKGVYRLSHATWSDPPHFAQAYYAEEQKQLLISSLTDRGFYALVEALNKQGLNLAEEPDIRVQLSLLFNIEHMLGKKVQLNPYEDLFRIEPEPGVQEEMDKLNKLLSLALPLINAGLEPDIRALAKQAGVEETTAREILQIALEKTGKLKG